MACGDTAAPPHTGVLRVSVATLGEDPDPDGYQVRIDDRDPIHLDPNGLVDLDLAAGAHRLDLLGLAGHCSADPSTSQQVEVEADHTTTVTFEIDCPLTGAHVAVSTSGLDRDSNGFAVKVDGFVQDSLGQSGTLLLRLEPGAHTIALTGVAQNCTPDDPLRRVTIVAGQTAAVVFAIVCTAATGVLELGVVAVPSSFFGPFHVTVDGRRHDVYGPSPRYVSVPGGPHIVSLELVGDCRVDDRVKEVTVNVGGLVRDTVGVRFSVTCNIAASGYVRARIRSIGAVPQQALSVWICDWADDYYCRYSDHTRLGSLSPGDTLIAGVPSGYHRAWLEDLPEGCGGTNVFQSTSPFVVTDGDTLNVVLETRC